MSVNCICDTGERNDLLELAGGSRDMPRDNERKASQECRPREGKRNRGREMCTERRRRERVDIALAVILERKYEDDQSSMRIDTCNVQ